MFGVDVGGTFTDVVAIIDGKIQVTKVPSVPENPHESVLEGARRLGVEQASLFNHASTKGLNAVITRNLPKIGFITTQGHRDMLDGGRAWRPFEGQMNPGWRRGFGDASRPLIPRYLRRGIKERILATGEVLIALDENDARAHLELLKRCNVEGLAICLINSYVNESHEMTLLKLAREILGDIPVSISFQTSPRAKEYSRATTTVIDVMMKLIYGDYAGKLSSGLQSQGFKGALNFADCSASLIPWQDALEHPHKIIFAGPAAGVAACARLGEAIGEKNLICCDVGGTSTDVALVTNGFPYTNDMLEIEYDMVINALATEVSTVGAGGGSIVSVSPSGDIQVGPESAGANPGPACYGRGGEVPTVTDACLLMGILASEGFADGQIKLDSKASEQVFNNLSVKLGFAERVSYAWRIAVNNIAEEVANSAIRHGSDPADFTLVAYGAGGPMLLAGVLDLLSLDKLIIPPNPGLFSALGLLATDLVYTESRSAYHVFFPGAETAVADIFSAMEEKLLSRIKPESNYQLKRSFDGRILGQSWETPFITVPDGPIDAAMLEQLIANFHSEYLRRNGQSFPEMPVQGVSYRVQLIVDSPKFTFSGLPEIESAPTPVSRREIRFFTEKPIQVPVYNRDDLGAGTNLSGPLLVQEALATTLVLANQQVEVGQYGELIISREVPGE